MDNSKLPSGKNLIFAENCPYSFQTSTTYVMKLLLGNCRHYNDIYRQLLRYKSLKQRQLSSKCGVISSYPQISCVHFKCTAQLGILTVMSWFKRLK